MPAEISQLLLFAATPPRATLDPGTVSSVTLSNGNLTATSTGTTSADQGAHVVTTSGRSIGKYYFELTWVTLNAGGNIGVGIGTTSSTYSNMGISATQGAMIYRSGAIYTSGGVNTGLTIGARASGDTIGVAVDLDNRKAWFKKVSGTPSNWNNSGAADPATNVGGVTVIAGTMIPFCIFGGASGVAGTVATLNFGGSAFVGAVPNLFTEGWPV